MPHAVTARRRLAPPLRLFAAALIVSAPAMENVRAQATTDCFADRIVAFRPGFTSSPPLFNSWQPGMLFGPPGNATPTTGSLSVMSLGRGGEIVFEFTDNIIVDGPGPDFIAHENPFFCAGVPASDADPYSVFAEPGLVAVSDDGIDFRTMPYDAAALSQTVSQCSDKAQIRRILGVMGITPNFTGNWTVPDDPLVFDPAAPGGVSGHGGDAFDLATVGLARARFVRITDPDLGLSLPGSSEGLDLDTVVVINGAPRFGDAGALADGDGDGLPDEIERVTYGTNPADDDSDGDGAPDGAEAASCRNPLAAGVDPFFVPAIEVEIADASPTVLRWGFLGSNVTYDAIRGEVRALRAIGGMVDLGVVTCVENGSTDLTTRTVADAGVPPPGGAYFYAVRQNPPGSGTGYGMSSTGEPRQPASGDCP